MKILKIIKEKLKYVIWSISVIVLIVGVTLFGSVYTQNRNFTFNASNELLLFILVIFFIISILISGYIVFKLISLENKMGSIIEIIISVEDNIIKMQRLTQVLQMDLKNKLIKQKLDNGDDVF